MKKTTPDDFVTSVPIMTDDNDSPKRSSRRRFVYSVIVVICLAVSLTTGLVLHFMREYPVSRSVAVIDCHPEGKPSEETCTQRGCVWTHLKDKGAPLCVFPEEAGYKIDGPIMNTSNGKRVQLKMKGNPQLFGEKSRSTITVDVEFQTDYRLRIKFSPVNESWFEIPNEALDIPSSNNASKNTTLYDVIFVDEPRFGIVVRRRSTNATVFNTTLPGLYISQQFLQISTSLTSDTVYGFGEHNHRQFKHDMNWKTWTIFTRDVGPIDAWNLYGAHPVYMNLEQDGLANMVFLKNSNAMDVSLQPNPFPAITFRSTGGILDFYIFLGPTPEKAVQQYTEAIGRPVMPPYWTLGFHLCRWGYLNETDMKTVINRNRAAGIPYDAQWGDIDYMHKKFVFSRNKETYPTLPAIVDDLHAHGQKFVIIVDPGIGNSQTIISEIQKDSSNYTILEDGIKKGIFIKNSTNQTLVAEVWPGSTVYPDFTNPKTEAWWLKWIRYFHQDIKFDSIWIDMNEPSSFVPGSQQGCEKNTWNNPPFCPNVLGREGSTNRLYDKTICMDAQQKWGKHYDVHSLYAHSQAKQTFNALHSLTKKRPWTMTRSSFAGTGKYATKWMGDNQANWENMRWSIIGIMEFSMFGFSLNGADICGFWGETKRELCLRWHQLGAFYPFSRNHNGLGEEGKPVFKAQDPGAWDEQFVVIVKHALLTRYKILPYLYTLMHLAHVTGSTVMRPLVFQYPADTNTHAIDTQFVLGSALLISPVLHEGKVEVDAYFPAGRWYNFFTGLEIKPTKSTHTLATPLDKFNLHIRGGSIIPTQEPSTTTTQSRKNPMGIVIALDSELKAKGELFWDDGESYETYESGNYTHIAFTMEQEWGHGSLSYCKDWAYIIKWDRSFSVDPAAVWAILRSNQWSTKTVAGEVRINVVHEGFASSLEFQYIDIHGLRFPRIPQVFYIDGNRLRDSKLRMSQEILQIRDIRLPITQNHNITWTDF